MGMGSTSFSTCRGQVRIIMYGVSKDLPVATFVGEECNMIGLGQFQIQFHFSGGRMHIDAESKWVLAVTNKLEDQYLCE